MLKVLACLIIVSLALGQDMSHLQWIRLECPVSDNLTAVDFLSDSLGWIVGENGTILHTSDGGKTWEKQECSKSSDLYDVDFVSPSHGWAAGSGGVLFTRNGGRSWTRNETIGSLLQVQFVDSSCGWASGLQHLYRTTDGGSTWIVTDPMNWIASPVMGPVDCQHCWTVNAHGDLGRTTDGGKSWALVYHFRFSPVSMFCMGETVVSVLGPGQVAHLFDRGPHRRMRAWLSGTRNLRTDTGLSSDTLWIVTSLPLDVGRVSKIVDGTVGRWIIGEKGLIMYWPDFTTLVERFGYSEGRDVDADGDHQVFQTGPWPSFVRPTAEGENLEDISITRAAVWIVGENGTILRGYGLSDPNASYYNSLIAPNTARYDSLIAHGKDSTRIADSLRTFQGDPATIAERFANKKKLGNYCMIRIRNHGPGSYVFDGKEYRGSRSFKVLPGTYNLCYTQTLNYTTKSTSLGYPKVLVTASGDERAVDFDINVFAGETATFDINPGSVEGILNAPAGPLSYIIPAAVLVTVGLVIVYAYVQISQSSPK